VAIHVYSRQTNREALGVTHPKTQHLIPEGLNPVLKHTMRCPEGTSYLLILD